MSTLRRLQRERDDLLDRAAKWRAIAIVFAVTTVFATVWAVLA